MFLLRRPVGRTRLAATKLWHAARLYRPLALRRARADGASVSPEHLWGARTACLSFVSNRNVNVDSLARVEWVGAFFRPSIGFGAVPAAAAAAAAAVAPSTVPLSQGLFFLWACPSSAPAWRRLLRKSSTETSRRSGGRSPGRTWPSPAVLVCENFLSRSLSPPLATIRLSYLWAYHPSFV